MSALQKRNDSGMVLRITRDPRSLVTRPAQCHDGNCRIATPGRPGTPTAGALLGGRIALHHTNLFPLGASEDFIAQA